MKLVQNFADMKILCEIVHSNIVAVEHEMETQVAMVGCK